MQVVHESSYCKCNEDLAASSSLNCGNSRSDIPIGEKKKKAHTRSGLYLSCVPTVEFRVNSLFKVRSLCGSYFHAGATRTAGVTFHTFKEKPVLVD